MLELGRIEKFCIPSTEITNGCCMLMFRYCCMVAALLIMFVSFTLLFIVYPINNSDLLRKCVLYYDPTVECQTLEYSIFTAVAICVDDILNQTE